MTDVTWGDFVTLAFSRMEYALAALTLADADCPSTPGQHAARSEALADVFQLLHRGTSRFGPLAPDPLGIAEGDVARLHSNVEILGRLLRDEAFYAWPEPDPAASHLAEAVGFLRFAGDLLASHHGPDGEPRSPYAAYLDSAGVARHMVSQTAELASVAGRVAVRIGQLCPSDRRVIRSHDVAYRLRERAVLIERAAIGIQRQLHSPRPSVPAPGLTHLPQAATAPPPPVRPGESQYEALRAVGGGLEWLAAHVAQQASQRLPDATVAELSIAADHSAVAHLLTARLIEHTRDLLTSDPVAQGVVDVAGGALREAAQAWQQAAASWKSGLGSAPAASNPRLVREAEFAVVRLGRTLFSPGWTRRDTGRRAPRTPHEIITAPGDATHLLAAAHAVPAAGQILAEHVPRIGSALVQRGALLSSDPAHNPRGSAPSDQFRDGWTRWYPASPEQIRHITNAYDSARQASAAAQIATARAAEAVGRPLGRAVLEADRRNTLGFTGDPFYDTRRVKAAAARARSTTVARPSDPARLPAHRASELSREVGALHPRRKTR
ncbi:hypothetical protein [Kitasatospora sp. MY 5-36]|uniref:hypothetical protein n=1 Tax=Kitasatospora sp. MY 5-36 TaxID=1678027 RepID=UPI000670E306|nr:hypothetical protein [Kitasatospora sp. MY 5-36]